MLRVKLLMINCVFPPAGGIAVQCTFPLAKHLPTSRFEVRVLGAANSASPVMDSDSLRHVLAEVTLHHAFTPELPPFATLPAANDPRREFPEVALISEFHHEWLSFYRNWPWPSAPNRWERYGGVIDQQDADPAHRLGTPKLTGRVFGPAGVPLRFQPDWQQIRSFERLRLGENYSAFILAHAITGADLLPPIPSSS